MERLFFPIFFLFINFNLCFSSNFHPIEEGLAYRSARPTPAELATWAKTHRIKTVINLKGRSEVKEKAACDRLGLKLIEIPLNAERLPEPSVLLALYEAFMEAEHPILIHCESGINRTGAAGALWRMTYLNESREMAGKQLSAKYNYKGRYPAMEKLVEVFVPDPDWIRREYGVIFSRT